MKGTIMPTKKDLINEFREIKHNNFELLWERVNGQENSEKAVYFLTLETYKLKYWTKLKLTGLICSLNNYIKYNF